MKKFLTVLLALSVVFTYSFSAVGAVFAAGEVGYDDANLIKEATAYAKAQIPGAIKQAYEEVASDENAYATKAAWEAVADDVAEIYEEAYDEAMEKRLAGEGLANEWNKYPENLANVAQKLYPTTTAALQFEALCTAFAEDENEAAVMAAKEQFKIDLAEALSIYDKVDLDALYSKTTPEGADKSYYEQAVEKVENSKKVFNEYFIAEDGSVKNLEDKVSTIAGNAAGFENVIYTTGKLADKEVATVGIEYYEGTNNTVVKYYYIKGIPTKDTEAGENAEIEATTAAIKAQIAKNVAVFLKDNKTSAAKAFADNYASFYNLLAEKLTMLNDAGKTKLANDMVAHEKMMDNLSKSDFADQIKTLITAAESMEAFGAKYAAEKDASGALVRDPAEVDKLVEKAIVAEYAGLVSIGVKEAYSFEKAVADIKAMTTKGDAAKLAFDKEAKKSDLDDQLEAALENYYELEAAAIKAAYAAAKEKVDAAKSTKEFSIIDTELNVAVDKVKTSAEVDALFTTGKMKAELEEQVTELKAYINYKNTNTDSFEDAYVLGLSNAKTLLTNYYIENGARTVEEMKALTGAVEAVAAILPTTGSLEAARKAAEDAIKALPTAAKTTSADRTAYQNAFDLAEAYNKMFETAKGTKGTLAIASDQAKALRDAIQKDFYEAYAKTAKTDKAALKAIAADVKTANAELTAENKMLDKQTDFVNPAAQDLADFRIAEYKAIIAAIKALPINVTLDDKEQIEAARALYDAYVAEYMDYTDAANGYVPTEFKSVYRDLALAEAALSVLEKDAAIKAVEGLKITASSKAAKGSMTINWKVKGDASYADGFRVYKSKKMNSGFGKTYYFQTKDNTKRSYKNTKELKKGTRYYYKVRAYVVIDGKTYFSDYSNKAYRIAK